MRSLLCLALLAALVRADDDAEVRFLKAWYAMGEPGKAAAAEETFKALHDAEGTPPELKARCLLALAECARLTGDVPKHRRLLDQLVAEHKGTEAAARARGLLGPGEWLDAIRLVPKGWYLDLDDGTVSEMPRPVRGKDAEMRGAGFLVEATPDAEMATKAAPVSAKPWQRVVTSEGRASWIQVLRVGGDDRRGASTAVRIVTRRSGTSEILPAPKDPFCIGGQEGIEIHFEASPLYARYRIERTTEDGKTVELQATTSPFLDRTAEPDMRYLYRVLGETQNGSLGLAATLDATRESRGVVSGVAELDRGGAKSFDFLLGTVVDKGDITVTGTYGGRSGVSFIDVFGLDVLALAPGLGPTGSPWDQETQGSYQVTPGSVFLVRLRGGGVARCRLEIPEQRRGPAPPGGGPVRDPEVILHYEACGDAAALPMPARLEAKRSEEGAVVHVTVEPPYRVDRVEVTDAVTGEQLAPLAIKDGVARDPTAKDGQIREYRAVATDAHGRRAAAATATLALFPEGPRAGEFAFHFQQGYSIETGRIVPAEEADVFFSNCAGGISSITLAAPGGIVNLENVVPREVDPGTAQAVFDLFLRADPETALGREAQADSRRPASDVFLLRTRHGGWAKLAIVHRGSEGGWTEYLATVKFVFNPKEPVFKQGEGDMVGGMVIADLQPLIARTHVLQRWNSGWRDIINDPVRRKVFEDEEWREQGAMPDAATTQEVLWSRQKHGDYEKATFSFVFGIRDDPGLAQTRNDWCLQYGNGGNTFDVCMVTDDRSTITDLGAEDWKGLVRRKRIHERGASRAPARCGHLYLVHTFDTDENFFTLFRVTALRPGDLVAFEWLSLRGEKLSRSPGLALDEPTEKALTALVAALPRTPEERVADPAGAIRMRLATPELRIGVVDEDPATLLRDLGEVTGVRFAVKAKRVAPVSVFSARLTPEGLLDEICGQNGLRWRVEEDGSVSIGGE